MLTVRDDDNEYALGEFGECLMIMDLENPKDYCQVDAKDFSDFEQRVWQFLKGEQA
jgi:hypothetical protein